LYSYESTQDSFFFSFFGFSCSSFAISCFTFATGSGIIASDGIGYEA
jgi:hypothetical protein